MCVGGVRRLCWGRGSLGPLLFGYSISRSDLCQMACHKCPQLWGGEGWRLTTAAWAHSGANSHTHNKQGKRNLESD